MSNAMKFDDIDLMQYVDGELDETTAGEIASLLAAEDSGAGDAALKIAALEQMNDVLRSHLELVADDAEPRLDAMWDVIERRIQGNGASEARPIAAHVPRSQAAQRGGLWAAIGRFFEAHRGHFVTGAVAAAAAAVLVVVLRPADRIVVERPVAMSDPGALKTGPGNAAPVNDSAPAEVKLVNDDPSPPEIEHLDVSGGSGTVFVMPREGEDDVSATVIFLDVDDVEGPL